MKISITTNFPAVQRQLQAMQAEVGNRAVVSALNKTAAQAKTSMSREIRAEFRMSASDVNRSLMVKQARATGGSVNFSAELSSISKRGKRSLNMINFMESSVTLAQARKRSKAGKLEQLHVQIKRAGGKKALGSAFIGNEGRTIFVRTGKGRLPIKGLQTIDVASMFNTRRVNARVLKMIHDRFPELFEHEAKFFTDRFNAQKAG